MTGKACFEPSPALVDAARRADERKRNAIEYLTEKLREPFSMGERGALSALILADQRHERAGYR